MAHSEQHEESEPQLVGKVMPAVVTASILAVSAAAVSLYLDSNDHIKRIIDNETDIVSIYGKVNTLFNRKESIEKQDLETKIKLDNLWDQFITERSRCTDQIAKVAVLEKEVNRLKWIIESRNSE